MTAEDIRNQFFVGRAVQQVILVAVCDTQHFIAVIVIAPAFTPQISGLNCRHQHSHVARTFLFFVYDLFDPLENFEPQRQPRINTGAGLFDHPSLQHVAVADDLCVTGALFENR